MGYDRVHDFHRHGAEYIASADMSCLLHMKGVIDRLKLPLKVIHIAQILNGGPFDQRSEVRGQRSEVTVPG
jgi:L-lactate dehydrogenase complex protein LldE